MDKTLAQIAYEAYGDRAGWVNYLGKPMPTWAELPNNIRSCWDAAVIAILVEVR